jgi:ribosomal protein S18 acetylase RimI-like enzyme
MMSASPEPFTPPMLEALVTLANEALAGRRAAAPVAAGEFRHRVLDHPGFDPAGLLVVRGEDGLLLGAVHAVAPPLDIPLYERLAGRGYIFGPYISATVRGRGLGRMLLAEAESYLAAQCEQVFVHGLRAPFYHAQEGPRQPYCGSTEIIGLSIDDTALLDFLHTSGYRASEEEEVSMVAPLRTSEGAHPTPAGLCLLRVTPQEPWSGAISWSAGGARGYGYEQYGPMTYDTLALIQDDTLVGHCQWYPMRRPGRVALFDLKLDPMLRGRGLGRLLLERGLASMADAGYREVELHTSPQRNDVAYAMYRRRGFREVAQWIVMSKAL